MIRGVSAHCFGTRRSAVILCCDLRARKAAIILLTFQDGFLWFFSPCLGYLTRGLKHRPTPPNLVGIHCSEMHLSSRLPTWHCDTSKTVINQFCLTYWPCNQIHDRNLQQTKGAKWANVCFWALQQKTARIVCRRKHNGVSVQKLHKWKLVRAEEKTEGERKACANKSNWLWLFNLQGSAIKWAAWSLGSCGCVSLTFKFTSFCLLVSC